MDKLIELIEKQMVLTLMKNQNSEDMQAIYNNSVNAAKACQQIRNIFKGESNVNTFDPTARPIDVSQPQDAPQPVSRGCPRDDSIFETAQPAPQPAQPAQPAPQPAPQPAQPAQPVMRQTQHAKVERQVEDVFQPSNEDASPEKSISRIDIVDVLSDIGEMNKSIADMQRLLSERLCDIQTKIGDLNRKVYALLHNAI